MKKKQYETSLDNERIGRRAVRITQEENRNLGIPNVYSKNVMIVYELPDGTYTTEKPKGKIRKQKKHRLSGR